jgi:hypothetical protein
MIGSARATHREPLLARADAADREHHVVVAASSPGRYLFAGLK